MRHSHARDLVRSVAAVALTAVLAATLNAFWSAPAAQAVNACPCTIWSSGTVPAHVTADETSAVEVGVKFKVDVPGSVTGVRFYKGPNNTGTHVGSLWTSTGTRLATGTFTGETVSGWQNLAFASPVPVTPGTVYVASYYAPHGDYAWTDNYFTGGVDSGPLHAPATGNGVYSYGASSTFPSNTYQATNYWVDVTFTRDTAPPGPILLVTSGANHFSGYYAEILRNEGYNEFDTADLGTVTASSLASHDVVVLGEMPLTAAQAGMFTTWVNGGGKLIAMRPDRQLAGLLGLTDAGGTLANSYLTIHNAGPGLGLTTQSMQFHGTADRYALNGATSVADLDSNATTGTGQPAVSLNAVGTGGGQAAAFTYDLARSVVLTRQGNPAWVGQNREAGDDVIRSDDLFYGNAAGDPQPDWLDTAKIAIPQADEQQRLLGNLITQLAMDRKPLPHFWYLPNGAKAALVMTGDDHAFNGTAPRFDTYLRQSPAGCDVTLWQCVRASSYIYPSTPITDAQVAAYTAQGFEVATHVSTNCANWTAATINGFYDTDLGQFAANFPHAPAPSSNRNHCVTWSDWDSAAKAELAHGIRYDANYYVWPPAWLGDKPGFMTGGGFPMRFADTDGTTVDVYQAQTQMTDESGQAYPATVDALLDNATGPAGYYGVFTCNMETDNAVDEPSDLAVASAQRHGVPVVSGRQMLTWLDGRNSSTFTGLSWSGNALTFTVTAGNGAQKLLRAMLPTHDGAATLKSISLNGNAVSLTRDTIKGTEYAFFPAKTGTYTATYTADTTPPAVTGTSPAAGATNVPVTSNVTATFSEPLNPATVTTGTVTLRDAASQAVPATVTYGGAGNQATLTPSAPLALGATYTATVKGGAGGVTDTAGNPLAADRVWSFTTASTVSLWAPTTTPGTPAVADPSALELGVKFRADTSGYVRGIRFYKGAGNTGTHAGSLWTSTGTRLATATFSGESAGGWQQVLFAQPVQVTAGTVYVASYHTDTGNYAADNNYFAAGGVDSPPLHALKDGVAGGNGLFLYTAASAFPTSSFQATNYWVDVVFATSP